jgi:hypothetical protein
VPPASGRDQAGWCRRVLRRRAGTIHVRTQPSGEAVACGRVGARHQADLAELADWVEGLRAAAQTARAQGNIALAEALDITRFEVYEGYLDAELDLQQSHAAARRSA